MMMKKLRVSGDKIILRYHTRLYSDIMNPSPFKIIEQYQRYSSNSLQESAGFDVIDEDLNNNTDISDVFCCI
jgi:hypothetical protein